MLQRITVFEMAKTQVRDLEIDIILRCSASTKDKYVCRFDILVPSIPGVS